MSGAGSRPTPKGWCPGAYRPMMSGDGLVVRIRPMLGRLTADQALAVCDLAERYGSGLMDVTSRANVQLRGVDAADHEALLQELAALDLLPDDPALEMRRNILVNPDWVAGDVTHRLALALLDRLGELPDLPAKFGFAVDCGVAPILRDDPADIRFEMLDGQILVRADGMGAGRLVSEDTAVDAALQMAQWFVQSGGLGAGRMKRHVANARLPVGWDMPPAPSPRAVFTAGPAEGGAFYGAPFGQIEAALLRDLIQTSGCRALRVTPWRLIQTEDAAPVAAQGFVTQPDDPLLRVKACSGAPKCASATVPTHAIARALAGKTQKPLHISGCSKGCAHPRRQALTLVGSDGAFDLVRDGRPWDEPAEMNIAPDTLLDRIGDL